MVAPLRQEMLWRNCQTTRMHCSNCRAVLGQSALPLRPTSGTWYSLFVVKPGPSLSEDILRGDGKHPSGVCPWPRNRTHAHLDGMRRPVSSAGCDTLHQLGVPATDAAYRRGVAFLLRTQSPDGSWHVASRAPKFQPYFQSGFPHDHDQWISGSATAWAAIALSYTSSDGTVTVGVR